MRHQPRRRRARTAAAALAVLVVLGVLVGRTSPTTGPLGQPSARAQASAVDAPDTMTDRRTAPIVRALRRSRARAGLPPLTPDADLAATAASDACAIARGAVPLTGDPDRLAAADGDAENVGMVIDEDPTLGARTMRRWWARSPSHRVTRMDATMARYGIGACSMDDRTYYVERFAR